MSDLEVQIEAFLEELTRRNCSEHTLRAYRADLEGFRACFPESFALAGFKVSHIREWMATLWEKETGAATIRRHIAAGKAFFQYLKREGLIADNPVRFLTIPKMAHTLPSVLSVEQMGTLIDGIQPLGDRHAARDLAICELLYGCGLRASELAGLNLEDIDRADCWLRIRGKGRKERQVPYGRMAKAALEKYLPVRKAGPFQNAALLSGTGRRVTTRDVGNIVKKYGLRILGDPSIHPHSFRHAFATHLLDSGAGLREIQELLDMFPSRRRGNIPTFQWAV